MSNIASLCSEILKQLNSIGRLKEGAMLPGLPEEKIHALTTDLPFKLPSSVIEMYTWSEGLSPSCWEATAFFPGFTMEPLFRMVQIYNELSRVSDFPRFHSGDKRWFPVFQNESSDFYGVCCHDVVAKDGAIVYDYNEGSHRDCITPPTVYFLSLEAMLRTLLECYCTGVYYINDEGQLDVGTAHYNTKGQLAGVSMSQFNEIARNFNPGLNY